MPAERIIDRHTKRFHDESQSPMESMSRRSDQSMPPSKRRHLLEPILGKKPVEVFSPQQSPSPILKQNRTLGFPDYFTNTADPHKESAKLTSRLSSTSSGIMPGRMPESIQKKVRNLMSFILNACAFPSFSYKVL